MNQTGVLCVPRFALRVATNFVLPSIYVLLRFQFNFLLSQQKNSRYLLFDFIPRQRHLDWNTIAQT